MTIQAGPYTFDHVVFDDEGDVLYMAVGSPRRASGRLMRDNTFLRFDHDTDELVGMTVINARLLLQRDGVITVTLPDGSQVPLQGVEAAIKQPA
jgi:uncharacterized protein YuzE